MEMRWQTSSQEENICLFCKRKHLSCWRVAGRSGDRTQPLTAPARRVVKADVPLGNRLTRDAAPSPLGKQQTAAADTRSLSYRSPGLPCVAVNLISDEGQPTRGHPPCWCRVVAANSSSESTLQRSGSLLSVQQVLMTAAGGAAPDLTSSSRTHATKILQLSLVSKHVYLTDLLNLLL